MSTLTKKILSFAFLASIMILPTFTMGFDTNLQEFQNSNLSDQSVYSIIQTTMNWLLTIITIIAIIGFIISGIYFITAQGSGKIEEAKQWMIYSIIGIVIALIGYIIINLISSLLWGDPTQTTTVAPTP